MQILRTMLLAVLTTLTAAACSTPGQLLVQNNDGEFIDYAGSVTLSGFYFSEHSNIETQQFVCFFPDSSSQDQLPKYSDVDPIHWMCFSNSTGAKELLGLDSALDLDSTCYKGSAKITIRNYRRYIGESEGVSFAELTHVHQSGAALAVPCSDI